MLFNTFHQASYPVNEYRLVLLPPKDIAERLALVKRKLKVPYLLKNRQLGSDYILLAAFGQYAANEENILSQFHNIAATLAPFSIQVSMLEAHHAQSIVLPVPVSTSLQALLRDVRQRNWLMRLPMQRPFIVSHPHICLAHHLSTAQFDAIWHNIGHRRVTATFEATSMVVQRRCDVEKKWQTIASFPFQNMPAMARQGALFA